MTDNINLTGIEAAYMTMFQADLGRQRQEELPLSDRERRGPSFAPTGRNGTSHYSPQLKDNLKSKWSVPIQDAESEQVEGLANDDARPWAKKIAKAFMASNTVASAPPRVAQVSQGAKAKTSNVRFSSSQPVGRLGGLIPPGAQSVIKPSSRDPMPAVVEKPVVEKPRTKLQQSPNNLHPPLPGTQMQHTPAPDYVLCKGECEIKPVQEQTNFKAEFAMKIASGTNCGYLVLSAPGKGERVHNVLELDPPVMKDGYCHVTSGQAQGNANYSVRLPDADLTNKFKLYLDNLRRAAIRQLSAAASSTTPVVQKSSAGDTVTKAQATARMGSPRRIASSADTVPSKKALVAPPPPEVTPEPSKTSAPASLVDISDQPSMVRSPINKGDVSGMSIEDAAEHLHSLVQRIIPEITGHGLRMDDATIDDIEETAIDFWLNRGFLGSESDDMKAELLELLRLLARIKRKAELLRGAQAKLQSRLASTGLEELDSGKFASARIQYTPAQIQSLEDKASPRPKRLEKVRFSPKPALKTPAKAPIFQLSEIRKWVEGNANFKKKTPVQASHVSLASANGSPAPSIATQQAMATPSIVSQGTSMAPIVATQPPTAAPLDASRARVQMRIESVGTQIMQPAASNASASDQPAATKPAPKGLSSSRWAN
ncbi:Uncharacterized protein TPAR_02556 [Tolypocladium paradoxum]|uniref:Uncharacterized protein n=1 Tax=Tolypocladium paradoxum TaxID=94208 RepID=A0A2S4L495_9HYPO|nr:Uncharacterized protein TPAR_02556 [Tolypocladium paradoxum]